MIEYGYKCNNKDCLFEFNTGVHLDVGSAKCPECGKVSLRRVFYPPYITFKGKGFYTNDVKPM
jgi:putative FmdB family regulatory protein